MAKAIPVIVGERAFATKTEARRFFSSMLARYKPGDRVERSDSKWLHQLIELHPSADDKIRDGIEYFSVQENDLSYSFWLHRFDGSSTDWSYKECITASTQEQKVLAGFRSAISESVVMFRDLEGPSKIGTSCPLSGEVITSDNMMIAHERSFKGLVLEFLLGERVALGSVAVLPSKDGATKVELADSLLRKRWCRYHNDNARLIVVTEYRGRHRPKAPRK